MAMALPEPGPERHLDGQERLTGTLLRARPVYSDPVSGCDPARDWPDVFEEMLARRSCCGPKLILVCPRDATSCTAYRKRTSVTLASPAPDRTA